MSSRRKLKKDINTIMDLMYTECIFYKVFNVEADKDAANKIIERVADVHTQLLSRVNTVEGKEVKGRVKNYFKKLQADSKGELDILSKEIAQLP